MIIIFEKQIEIIIEYFKVLKLLVVKLFYFVIKMEILDLTGKKY